MDGWRPAGLDDRDILHEAASVVRHWTGDPCSDLAGTLTTLACDGEEPLNTTMTLPSPAPDEGMTTGVTARPVTPPVARMLFLAAEVEPLRVELERCEGDLAVAVREAGAARAALRDATERADRAEAKVRRAEWVHAWTNEDGKRFVFADDLLAALSGEASS